jgi:hypothetical protein
MDHLQAIQTKAAERYLLGEMTEQDRNEYEDHLFGCYECAQDLRAGAAFIDNAKDALAHLPEGRPAVARTGWWHWVLRPAFALPAMALLLAVVGYQGAYLVPHLEAKLATATAPQTLPSLSLLGADARGGEVPEIAVPANKPVGLFVDIPPSPQFSSYVCEVRDKLGAIKFAVNISAQEAQKTVLVLVPASRLAPGTYAMVVHGLNQGGAIDKAEIARYPFILEFSK